MNDANKFLETISKILANGAVGDWTSISLETRVLARDCSRMSTAQHDDADSRSVGCGMRAAFEINDAIIGLRDHLLQTTGQRIYGLTFTLTPDGKFTIDYDYERPVDYDDSEETISLEEALGSLAQTDIAANLSDADNAPERRFLAAALARLQANTAEHARWGLGSETRWNLDMNAGALQLAFSDGRELRFPVQIIGTYNRQDGTFLWGWDHPSVPEPLRRAARRMREYGEREGFERFTTRTLACTENDAWEFTAAAAQLDGVTGAYRGDAGGAWVYMTFDAYAASAS